MGQSVFVRVKRVVTGGIETAVDTVERVSAAGVMRQAVRDMEAAIRRTRNERDVAQARRVRADHQVQACRTELATLKEQARFAVEKEREDLAAAAVGRQIDIEARVAELLREQAEAAAEEARLEQTHNTLKLRRDQMAEEVRTFEAAQRAAESETAAPAARAERWAERAEEAFQRAMEAAGTSPRAPADGDAAEKVAEIEALQREAAIAARLAALKTGTGAAAAAEPAARKAQGSRKARA